MLKSKSMLVTGGTGTFGKAFVRRILEKHPEVKRLVIFSRDELKQFEMAQELQQYSEKLRFFIGDVREPLRIKRALEGIDTVVHAAALKQVPTAEYNPFECIKTNVLGAQNIIEACLDMSIRSVVALSTDKAAAPVNLYGATKLCSDKLFLAAKNVMGKRNIRFSVVRYGNVMGSRGSVIPFFLKQRHTGKLPITDPAMTRFNISIHEGVDLVLYALQSALGGEIFVPKIPSYRVGDVAEAIGPNCKHEIIGIRQGEKIHEEMITASDSPNTLDLGRVYAILPASDDVLRSCYTKLSGVTPVPHNFRYQSGENPHFLTVEEIRSLIKEHIDPEFSV